MAKLVIVVEVDGIDPARVDPEEQADWMLGGMSERIWEVISAEWKD